MSRLIRLAKRFRVEIMIAGILLMVALLFSWLSAIEMRQKTFGSAKIADTDTKWVNDYIGAQIPTDATNIYFTAYRGFRMWLRFDAPLESAQRFAQGRVGNLTQGVNPLESKPIPHNIMPEVLSVDISWWQPTSSQKYSGGSRPRLDWSKRGYDILIDQINDDFWRVYLYVTHNVP